MTQAFHSGIVRACLDWRVEIRTAVEGTDLVVYLDQRGLNLAEKVAKKRSSEAIQKQRPNTFNCELQKLDADRRGSHTELAFAAVTGKTWWAVLDTLTASGKKLPDVGDNFQIRSTEYPHGCLTAHDADADDDLFVLAIWTPADASCVRFKGYLTGRTAKQQKYWTHTGCSCTTCRNGRVCERRDSKQWRPCYQVPQTDLFTISDLIDGWERIA